MPDGHDGEGPLLDTTGDITGFFEDAFLEAVRSRRAEPTDAARVYLVALLADFARPGTLSSDALERPVTLLLDEALRLEGTERFERLRRLGDTVLYTSGFFGEHLANRGVEMDYVQSVGARAYDSAADMLKKKLAADRTHDLFSELADDFSTFVALLGDVSDDMLARSARTDKAMVKVYEKWIQTGSTRLSAALVKRGLMPVPTSRTVH